MAKNVKKANLDKLNELHNSLADYLIEMLESGEEVSGSVLSTANAFLKNNDIVADIIVTEDKQDLSSRIKKLVLLEED